MKRLAGALVTASMAAMTLTGCGPSAEETACEQDGGVWVSYVVTYVSVVDNRTTIIQPIYSAECRYPEPLNGGQDRG